MALREDLFSSSCFSLFVSCFFLDHTAFSLLPPRRLFLLDSLRLGLDGAAKGSIKQSIPAQGGEERQDMYAHAELAIV